MMSIDQRKKNADLKICIRLFFFKCPVDVRERKGKRRYIRVILYGSYSRYNQQCKKQQT